MQEDDLAGLPARAALHPSGMYLALRSVSAAELRDPFMQQTVTRVAAPETVVHIERGDIGKAHPDTAPAGIIFHVGRCGSTVLSQALKQIDNLTVYSEPLPLNELLLPPHKWPRHELVGALRSLGDAFARHANGRYVWKLSSWNTLFCDLVVEAFPNTPWVFNVRDPAEVGVALLRQSPAWVREDSEEGRAISKLVAAPDPARSHEEYFARLYGALCAAVGNLDARRGVLVDYDNIPEAAWEVVAPHFGLRLDQRERELMVAAAQLNAKAPLARPEQFTPDSDAKREAASAQLRTAVDQFARPELARTKATL